MSNTTRPQVSGAVKARQLKALKAAGSLRQMADVAEMMGLAISDSEQSDLVLRLIPIMGKAVEVLQLFLWSVAQQKKRGGNAPMHEGLLSMANGSLFRTGCGNPQPVPEAPKKATT